MPASNVFTIPGAGKNKYPGKAQEAETREEEGGGKAERRLRAEMRAGTFGGGPEADQGWEDLLLGLEGVGGPGGGVGQRDGAQTIPRNAAESGGSSAFSR